MSVWIGCKSLREIDTFKLTDTHNINLVDREVTVREKYEIMLNDEQ
jgi:hypothetical protein